MKGGRTRERHGGSVRGGEAMTLPGQTMQAAQGYFPLGMHQDAWDDLVIDLSASICLG
jgi:hypothetical protein